MRKTVVKHVLIVLDEGSVSAELVAESVLGVREEIFLIPQRCHVGAAAIRLGGLVVLSKVRIERPLSVSRSVLNP